MRPTVKLQEGVFITDLPGYNLLVKSVNGHTNEMHGVTIYQMNAGGPPTTILAKSGYLTYTPDGRTAVIELTDGEIHEIPSDPSGPRRYHRLTFRKHTIVIQGAGGLLERSVRNARGDREKSARMLLGERDEVKTQYERSLAMHRQRFLSAGIPAPAVEALAPEHAPLWRRPALAWQALLHHGDALAPAIAGRPDLRLDEELWKSESEGLRKRIASLSVEIHKKFALPAACIVFVLIGAPIGMKVRRGGPAVAFVSIGFFLFYYVCLVGGEELANRLMLPAWLAMWIANIVLGALGLDLTARACEVPLPWHRRREYRRGPEQPVPRAEIAA